MHKPQPPHITLNELKANNALAYDIVLTVVRHAAQHLYRASPVTHNFGLEKCEEIILKMLEEGTAKILLQAHEFDDEEDRLIIGYFNSATGEYDTPKFSEQ